MGYGYRTSVALLVMDEQDKLTMIELGFITQKSNILQKARTSDTVRLNIG